MPLGKGKIETFFLTHHEHEVSSPTVKRSPVVTFSDINSPAGTTPPAPKDSVPPLPSVPAQVKVDIPDVMVAPQRNQEIIYAPEPTTDRLYNDHIKLDSAVSLQSISIADAPSLAGKPNQLGIDSLLRTSEL